MLDKILNLTQEKLTKDQEKALVELTYRIQKQTISPEDVKSILAFERNKNSVYGQYLLACLYSFGSKDPNINVDLRRASNLVQYIITNHRSTYAMNLYHIILSKMQELFFENDISQFVKLHDELCSSSDHFSVTVSPSILYSDEGIRIINAKELKTFDDLDYLKTIIVHVKEQFARNNRILKEGESVHNTIKQLIENTQEELKGIPLDQQVSEKNLGRNLELLQKLLDMYKQLSVFYKVTEVNQRASIIKEVQDIIDKKGIKSEKELDSINTLNTEFGKILGILNHNLTVFKLSTDEHLSEAEKMYQNYREEKDAILEFKDKSDVFLNDAAKKGNPIAILNLLYIVILNLKRKDDEGKLKYFSEVKDYIKTIATGYEKLKYTGYYSQLAAGIKTLHAILNDIEEIRYSAPAYGQFFQEKSYPKREIAECWKALYDFYRVIENDPMKYHAIQMASKLDDIYKTEWLQAMGGPNMPFKDITDYLSSFLQSVNIVEKKMTQTDDISTIKSLKLNLAILFNNCQFLYDHFFSEYAKDHEKQQILTELFSKCEDAKNGAFDAINSKITGLVHDISTRGPNP